MFNYPIEHLIDHLKIIVVHCKTKNLHSMVRTLYESITILSHMYELLNKEK